MRLVIVRHMKEDELSEKVRAGVHPEFLKHIIKKPYFFDISKSDIPENYFWNGDFWSDYIYERMKEKGVKKIAGFYSVYFGEYDFHELVWSGNVQSRLIDDINDEVNELL